MKKCWKTNKIISLLLFLFFSPPIFGKTFLLQDLQIRYLHTDKDNQLEGYTLEHNFYFENDYYVFSNLYDDEQKLYKKRRLKFDKSGNLLNYYEKDFKEEITTFDQYSLEASIFYKKENTKIKIEKFTAGVVTIAKIHSWLVEKITNRNLDKEILEMYIPHTPLLDKISLIVNCEKKDKNPYLGKQEPVFVCKLIPKSRSLRFTLGKKAKITFAFQINSPYLLHTLIIGEKFYYIKDYKKIPEERALLFQEIEAIDQDIQSTFLSQSP